MFLSFIHSLWKFNETEGLSYETKITPWNKYSPAFCSFSGLRVMRVLTPLRSKVPDTQKERNAYTSFSHLYWPMWRCTYIALSFHFSDTECRHKVQPSQGSQEVLQRLWSFPKQQLIAESDWDPEHMTILQLWPEIVLSTYNSDPERCEMAWCILRVKQRRKEQRRWSVKG